MGSRFEDIVVWQKARFFTAEIYRLFGKTRDYSFRDQVQRASVSIMNNIAEGCERKSIKEFSQFLSIAKGSAGEVRSMLSLGLDLGYISQKEHDAMVSRAIEISRMIAGLMKALH